jgi:hypothetical protein
MEEGDLCGMEHQAVSRRSVQTVADDGCIQSVRVGGMDSELVGTTGEGIEIDE